MVNQIVYRSQKSSNPVVGTSFQLLQTLLMEIQNEIPQVHRSGSGHNTQLLFIYIYFTQFSCCVFLFVCLVCCCRFPFCIQISPNIYMLTVRTTNTKPGIGHVHVFVLSYQIVLYNNKHYHDSLQVSSGRNYNLRHIDRRRFKVHYCSLYTH